MSCAHIDAFNRGKIIGHAEAGTPPAEIVKHVRKKDGSRPKVRAVQKTILKAKTDPKWKGQNQAGGPGRNRTMSERHQKMLVKLVYNERGQANVTTAYCKQRLPMLRCYSQWVRVSRVYSSTLAA